MNRWLTHMLKHMHTLMLMDTKNVTPASWTGLQQ